MNRATTLAILKAGESIPATHYAGVTESANAIRQIIGDSKFIIADRLGDTLRIGWVGPDIIDARPTRMRVKDHTTNNDYLVCRTWDGTTEGDVDIDVAKPFQLRHIVANYDGLTTLTTTDAQTVTAGDGVTTETWAVNLAYFVDCEIYAVKVPKGGTGDATATEWMDLNVDGRKWGVS